MIQHKLKTIFVHMPRCAGTAIKEKLSREPDLIKGHNIYYSHINIDDYRIMLGSKIVNEYFKFSCIRNPFDRVYSSFKLKSSMGDVTYDNFEKWLVKLTTMNWGMKGVRGVLGSHFDWIGYPVKVNYLIRYENFKTGWDYVCKKLDIKNDLPVVNKGLHHLGGYKKYHTKKTIEIVKKYFKKDLEVFGYAY